MYGQAGAKVNAVYEIEVNGPVSEFTAVSVESRAESGVLVITSQAPIVTLNVVESVIAEWLASPTVKVIVYSFGTGVSKAEAAVNVCPLRVIGVSEVATPLGSGEIVKL